VDDELRRTIEHAVAADGGVQWGRVRATGWAEAWSLDIGDRRHFVKIASGDSADMIVCEADGLRALAKTRTVRVPAVAASGSSGPWAFLVTEWLDMAGPADARLGAALAQLHRAPTPHGPRGERYGWHRDNWIGATPQANAWSDDWTTFFRDRRLAPQLALAKANGFGDELGADGERLLVAVPALLRGHAPVASLVHGDLWGGNAATLRDGEGAAFDPAAYVGDREVDVAMSELFAGFDAGFRAAYEARWPLDAGYPLRRHLYNCYHLLNHVNLFGGGHVARARRTMAALVASAH